MNWETILTGGFVAAITTVIWNFFSKKIDYDIEYKKYILKKRQEAYNSLEVFINKIGHSQGKGNHNIPSVLFPPNRATLSKFNSEVTEAFHDNIWFSIEMTDLFVNFSKYIHNLCITIPLTIDEQSLEIILWDEFKNFRQYRHKFQKQMLIDIIELPDIKKFKKKKQHFFPEEIEQNA